MSPTSVVPVIRSLGAAMSPNAFSATITSKRLGVRTSRFGIGPRRASPSWLVR